MNATHAVFNMVSLSVVGILAALPATADEPQVFTALKHEALFAALNVSGETTPSGVFYPGTEVFRPVNSSALPVRVPGFGLAVYPTRASAEQAAARLVDTAQVGPRATARFPDVGDARYIWEAGSGAGSVIFLRENIFVRFGWGGTMEDGIALARRIDQFIQGDRTIAPRGTFAQTPEIVSTGAPATIAKSGTVAIQPDIRGLGDPQKTMVKVIDISQSKALAQGKPGESLTLRAPDDIGGARTGRAVRLLMVAANEDNVFVAKEFTVNLTD
jgi:hypothetical protein